MLKFLWPEDDEVENLFGGESSIHVCREVGERTGSLHHAICD